jgi:hypothetical protein
VFIAADEIWLDFTGTGAAVLLRHFEKYVVADDVQIVDESARFAEIYLAGSRAGELLDRLGCPPPAAMYSEAVSPVGARVRRVPLTALPGWLISVPRDEVDAWCARLSSAGAAPISDAEFHGLRIEAGFPWFGVDLTAENLAQEAARTAAAISFKKGCYLGQEPIARIDALGHVNQELRRVRFATDAAPAPGTSLQDEDGRDAGRVTSSAASPVDGRGVALALLRRSHLAPGTAVVSRDGLRGMVEEISR